MRYFLDNMFWNESYYPTTIVIDRYNGCYSGGKWLAFPCFFYDVPEEIEGEDPEKPVLKTIETPADKLAKMDLRLEKDGYRLLQ